MLFLCSCLTVQADPNDRLAKLRAEISEIEQSIEMIKNEQINANNHLKLTEKRIDKLSNVVQMVNQQIQQQQSQITKLQQESRQLNTHLRSHRNQLSQQIRTAHVLGQQEYLKILLTAQNPAAISRTLTYYDYLNRQKINRIEQANTTLRDNALLQVKLETQEKKLSATRSQYDNDLNELSASRNSRKLLVTKLDDQIINKQQQLQKLQQDEKNLTDLLNNLISKPPENIIEPKQLALKRLPFHQLRGQLARPVLGKIIRQFGKRQLGELRSKGLLFEAQEGESIRAVASGQVVFADWIRGFGMMIIIDHGEQYMSLYGHNTSLHKESGDWVDTNDIIASAGSSGGMDKNGLYFELRHKGKPINPARWLKRHKN